MTSPEPTLRVNLFYSYCHKDAKYRDSMEESLALLKRNGFLKSWSDQSILPGQSISKKVREKMDAADIVVFLLSHRFISSEECMKEWNHAKQRATKDEVFFRIPIILSDCAWLDVLDGDDIKALPEDGYPVVQFPHQDTAWHQVYNGIKAVVVQLRNTFSPKPSFIREFERTGFLSQKHVGLQDTFVFLPLSCYAQQAKDDKVQEEIVTSPEQLLKRKFALIHGEDMSGKTALGKYLFLSLVEDSHPVLHIDLEQVAGKAKERALRDNYQQQFNGDYELWKRQKNKTLILDNLSASPHLIDFVVFAKGVFSQVFVTLPSDKFNAFFRDDVRMVDFEEMRIEPLTHRLQEELIRKRLKLSEKGGHISDGHVDQIEDRVNSIIISEKIVPRYPFFVLSILQTYEAFMPSNMRITSHGHCYYVMILANLIKAGIPRSDDAINACLHFAEHLAFRIHQSEEQQSVLDFSKFTAEYKQQFLISGSILSRLQSHDFGIVTNEGRFKSVYMYYFFLGRFLSKNAKDHKDVIDDLCEESHVKSNHLTLLFLIHHTNDDQIIDEILLRNMCTLDHIDPAVLDHDETKIFEDIVSEIPRNILSKSSVESERGKERDARDRQDEAEDEEQNEDHTTSEDPVNDLYRILQNNEILAQVLKNKYGTLEKQKIREIIEAVTDSGLRLINLVLRSKKEIADCAQYLHKRHPDADIHKIKNILQRLSFFWTMINVEKVVKAINFPEVREVVQEVVAQRSTPAYDIIGFFSQLDSGDRLTDEVKNELRVLLKKHNYLFLKSVLSLRTQHYMNTHHTKAKLAQSVCSLLKIKYLPRYVQ